MNESHSRRRNSTVAAAAGVFLLASAVAYNIYAGPPGPANQDYDPYGIRHVLLISVDGMHAVDFINCAQGGYCPYLTALARNGVNYLNTSTSKPSDSFPGLMALVTGGSPRTVGAFYDDAYDRSLDPPTLATWDGLAAGACTPGGTPSGSSTEFDEGIDLNDAVLNGGAPTGVDGGVHSIDPRRLDQDPARGCAPVWPWNFVRTNTIFGVAHQAGLYTAWSDKHPSYSAVNGPGNGTNVDDYYSPEINSVPGNLSVSIPNGPSCTPLPDSTATSAADTWTSSFQNIQCYDTLKVQAVLNWINGKTHNGASSAPTPAIFGMNFQAVSVGQKLIEKTLTPKVTGGYLDSIGTPTPALLGEIEFVDTSIGEMVSALQSRGLLNSTVIIITAKHGQSPIDSARYLGIANSSGDPITTSPETILEAAGCIPPGESSAQLGPTEDDVSLVWLNSSCTTADAVSMLRTTSPTTGNVAGIGEIFSGPILTTYFNPPGLPPSGDPRTPDILTVPDIGVTYSGSGKKLAEHGGFSRDDTNVIMLVSNPAFRPTTVTSYVETLQVAPTILQLLGLDPNSLQAVQMEHTQVLPAIQYPQASFGF